MMATPRRKRRLNPAHRRRALELLASSPHGATEKLLVVAHGFDGDMIAGLVSAGLATAEREMIKAGGKPIEVVRVRMQEFTQARGQFARPQRRPRFVGHGMANIGPSQTRATNQNTTANLLM